MMGALPAAVAWDPDPVDAVRGTGLDYTVHGRFG